MNRPARVTEAEIRRASKVARTEGVRVRLQCGDMTVELTPFDTERDTAPKSALEQWREKRNARQA